MTQKLSNGTVHTLPADFSDAIVTHTKIKDIWESLTPLARNEWICWVESAKKSETRTKRINVGISKLNSGMRRPCCWAGCMHRVKNGK